MISNNGTAPVRGYGPSPVLAYAVFTPANINTAQTLTEAFGITQIIRTSNGVAGIWTVTLAQPVAAGTRYVVMVNGVENDTTLFHFVRCESQAAGSFVISHKSVAYASVASGPAATDTVDAIHIMVLQAGSL